MSLNLKQIGAIFSDIREGKAALLLGQEYFKADDEYYSSVLKQLNIQNKTPSLNELWMDASDSLGEAMVSAAELASYQPWLRALLSLKWNIILSSSLNNLWLKNSIGSNFSLNIQTQEDLPNNLDFYKHFNKQQPRYIALFGDESSVPAKKELLKLKKRSAFLDMIYNQILSVWGYFVIDGLAEDDWFDIGGLLNNIETVPNGCIYIFGMDTCKAERVCKNEDDWQLLDECICNGQIILCEKSLKDAVIELGVAEDIDEDTEEDYENEVRISLPNNDAIRIPRKECVRLNSMGITLMRDEILSRYLLDDKNKDRCFADFIQQRDKKSWNYFDIIYNKKQISFHIPRNVEGLLQSTVANQLQSPNNMREIILLKGNSNSGKTTSLSWLAWYAASSREGISKGKNNKYLVFFISGDPANRESDWQDILVEFIKNCVYAQQTTKGDRIRNVIIIWDNYNSTKKKTDYVNLYNKLNECNAVLIGSIYLFESVIADSPVLQGVSFNELKPLNTTLDQAEKTELKKLLKIIDPKGESPYGNTGSSKDYLFETLINFAKYRYSPEWEKVRNSLSAGLQNEANASEGVSNDLFKIFKDKNAKDFNDVKKVVFSLGIGSVTQSKFMEAMKVDPERHERNIPLINSIRDMNLILAVANQFKKSIKLPLSVLMRTISNGKQYTGNYNKLNRILRSDSMVEYDSNSATGNIAISFRHPSEAVAYLDYNYGPDRKDKEIGVIMRLIENCRWDNYEEAKAVAAFVRSFGTNSYGKFNDQSIARGQYREYSEYWEQIAEHLNKYALSNPEAMLISGHFTRDHIETHNVESAIDFLQDAIEKMKEAVERCFVKSTCSRLYGEICRNLLQQMKSYCNGEDDEKIDDLSYDFEDYFKLAVKYGKESKQNNSFSLTLLLDIWLNYVIHIHDCYDYLLPDTLEYIDSLFYNESNLIDDSDDYVNVISGINRIYDEVNKRNIADLRDVFSNSGNDSYAYFLVKQILVKQLLDFKERYPKLFNKESIDKESNNRVISGRIFFLSERAADDFDHYQMITSDSSINDILREIKKKLKVASDKIIRVLESEFSAMDKMTYRCLLMYFKAKWMSYTDNLLLETEQYPALTNEQWREMSAIYKAAIAKAGDNDISRSLNFIQNIYAYVFENQEWSLPRYASESPVRLICLCGSEKKGDGKGVPRLFRVSVKESEQSNKLFATIDHEIVDGNKASTTIVGQKKIFVPENVKHYRDIRRNNLNIDRDFVIWFNIGGPQLRDYNPNQEV